MIEIRRIDAISIGKRFRVEHGDIPELAASIATLGLLQPIVITSDGRLIDGGRRLRACRLLGWTHIPVHVVDLDNILAGEAAANFERKDFTLSEAVAIKRALEPQIRAQAEQRMLAGNPVQTLHRGKSRDEVAKFTGVSHETLRKAEFVVSAAEAAPERFGRFKDNMDRTGHVTNIYKRVSNMLQADAIRAAPPALPTGPFPVIACDPPWEYPMRAEDPSHRAILGYPTMTVGEICALPVGDIAAKDCVLLLWITNVHLLQGAYLKLLAAWGFESKQIMTWVKTNNFGSGEWLRGQTEHVIVAARGKPAREPLTNESTVLFAPRRKHSEKPDEFYAMVLRLYPAPPGGYLEMFARKERAGWVTWGDEVPKLAAE